MPFRRGSASRPATTLAVLTLVLPLAVQALTGTSAAGAPGPDRSDGSDRGDRPSRSAASERRATSVDRTWSGFRIARSGDAAGSWIGARKVGGRAGRVVYRIDPRAVPRTRSLGRGYHVSRLLGPGAKRPAGRDAVRRAAWIVSKYGSYRYAIQSAAVDAALLHLLSRRDFALGGKRGQARLRQTGYAAQVGQFARAMLRDSRRFAGPYRVVVAQDGRTSLGEEVRLRVRVLSTVTRAPLRSVPVSVRVGSGAWQAAGETDDHGATAVAFPGRVAGPRPVTVRVQRVPLDRLLVLPPRPRSASRAVVAGRKTVMGQAATAVVRALPVARLGTTWIDAGQRTRGTLRVRAAYGTDPRRAVATLHGPFPVVENASCRRTLRATRRLTVAGSGDHVLPRLTLHRPGAYIWRVVVPGNRYNVPARACGGRFVVVDR